MRRAALLALALLAGPATAANVVAVTSESDGWWLPGRYSVVRIVLDGSASEVRVRLGEGREAQAVVERVGSSGDDVVWRAALLPRADVSAVEIDAGDGWRRHALVLRRAPAGTTFRPGGDRLVDLDLARAAPAAEVLPDERTLAGLVRRELEDASVPARDVRRDATFAILLTLAALAWFALSRRWRLRAAVVAVPLAALAINTFRPAPYSYRTVAVSSVGNEVTWDVGILCGRRKMEVSVGVPGRGSPGGETATVRPLADPNGRWPPRFELRDLGQAVGGLDVGGAFRRYLLVESDGAPREGPLEDAFWSLGQEVVWIGRVEAGAPWPTAAPDRPRIPIVEALERVAGRRGTILKWIGRPALRPGLYGFRPSEAAGGDRRTPAYFDFGRRPERAERVEHLVVP